VKITLNGTRGSVGRAGPETITYGGDTSCVLVSANDDSLLVLDAGSGIGRLNPLFDPLPRRIDILLTHLHMDHIQGLGFFKPVFAPDVEVNLWGPVSSTMDLADRLGRYLSPPLFPVRLRDLPNIKTIDVRPGTFAVGPFTITADLVLHPGPTLGYRIEADGSSLVFLPDHEPALGSPTFPKPPEWTSGYDLCRDVDVLVHDFQYTPEEYAGRQGWGHSSMPQTLAFAEQVGARRLVTFHHDPDHDDATLDRLHEVENLSYELIPGRAGLTLQV
jgi:phosphoribosyl 1,2-cyclic phosphodiesterase